MEPITTVTSKIPRWFWIALGLIVLATVFAVMYCNRKSKQNIDAISESQREEIKSQVRQDVFDLIPDLQAALQQ